MLGEQDQLLPRRRDGPGNGAGAIGNVRIRDLVGKPVDGKNFAEQARQFPPLGIRAAAAHVERQAFQSLEGVDLGPELGDGLRRGRLIEDGFLGGQDFVLGGLVEVLDVLGVEVRHRSHFRGVAPAAPQRLEFPQLALQPFAAATQRLIDGLRGGCQAPLQDRQRKPDGAGAPVVLQRLGAVELLAHVVGDRPVETGFRRRQLVGNGVGDTLREQRRAVELEQLLLHHAAQQVGDVGGVHAIAEAALEAVAVDEAP